MMITHEYAEEGKKKVVLVHENENGRGWPGGARGR